MSSPSSSNNKFTFTMRNIHNPFTSNPYGVTNFNTSKVGSP